MHIKKTRKIYSKLILLVKAREAHRKKYYVLIKNNDVNIYINTDTKRALSDNLWEKNHKIYTTYLLFVYVQTYMHVNTEKKGLYSTTNSFFFFFHPYFGNHGTNF